VINLGKPEIPDDEIIRTECPGVTEDDDIEDAFFWDEVTDSVHNIPEEDYTVYSCTNCGAHSLESPKDIKHYTGCKPGESKRWEKFYEDAFAGTDCSKCGSDAKSCGDYGFHIECPMGGPFGRGVINNQLNKVY
jgi:hypothetical protein